MTLQIISSDDDTWDDIDIVDDSFMYRTSRGIYTYYPDKDLLRACRTVLSPSFSDDDDTISTSASLQSVDDHDYPLSEMGDFRTSTDGVSLSYTTNIQPRNLLNLTASSSSSKLDYDHNYSNNTISRNNSLFDLIKDYEGRGTITRLGRTGGSVHVDIGDWSQDLEVPSALKLSTKLGSTSNTSTNQQSSPALGDNGDDLDDDHDPFDDIHDDDDDDDSGDDSDDFSGESSTTESSSQKRVRFDQMTTGTKGDADSEQQKHIGPTMTTTPLPLYQQKWKEEDEDEGFDDIDIPNDICTRAIKPHQYWQTNTTTATTTTGNSISNSSKIEFKATPLPPNIQKQFAQFKESDTDDFLDGLDIKEDIFKAATNSISSKKETSVLESKLPRPKRYQQQKSTITAIRQQTTSISSPRKKSSPLENRLDRLTAPTYASRQRGTNTTPITATTSTLSPFPRTRQNNSPHWDQTKPRTGHFSSSARSHRHPSAHPTNKYSNAPPTSTPFLRTGDGSALMTRPSAGRINYGNGSELDHLDDLAVWKKTNPTRPSLKTMRLSDGPKNGTIGSASSTKKYDMSSKPWRCNMSTRKMTLIKPEEQKLAKEINDMRYDDRERRWHGNEQATRTFDKPAKRRPALIKNMTQSRAAKSTSTMVVGNMTFDQQKMSWNTHNGEEVDVLAHIDDLSENETHHHRLRAGGVANQDQSDASNPTNNNKYDTFLNDPPHTMLPFENNLTPTSSFHHTDSLTASPSRLYRATGDISNSPGYSFNSAEMTTTVSSTRYAVDPTLSKSPIDHHIDNYLIGQPRTMPLSSGQHHSSGGTSEFDLPIDLQLQMTEQEEEHDAYFAEWPLRDECDKTTTPSGYSAPQNTYILY